jgi:hypothetical protein
MSTYITFSCDQVPQRAEGFANRNLQVAWGVLTHDLWVISEKLREQRKSREQKLRLGKRPKKRKANKFEFIAQ